MSPAEIRTEVLTLCEAWGCAKLTGNVLLQQVMQRHIEQEALPRLIPDNPTLAPRHQQP